MLGLVNSKKAVKRLEEIVKQEVMQKTGDVKEVLQKSGDVKEVVQKSGDVKEVA